MWHILAAALAACAGVAITIALVGAAGTWCVPKLEPLALKYGRGPLTQWLIEWGLFAVFLFGELLFLCVMLGGGGLAVSYLAKP